MAETIQQKLGDGNGPYIVRAREVTANVRVSREGELVVVELGTTVLRLKYLDAMRLGYWIVARAHEAKVQAGDMGKQVEIR